jgi:TonB family protein
MRAGRFALVSLVAHGLILVLLPRLSRIVIPVRPITPIEVELGGDGVQLSRTSGGGGGSSGGGRSKLALRSRGTSSRSVTPDAPHAAEGPRAPIDLFPDGVLQSSAGGVPAPSYGGTTRRLGDGGPVPGADRSQEELRGEATRRVRGWLGDARGEANARSGAVDPIWRDVERGIAARFSPTAEAITSKTGLQTFFDQLRHHQDPSGGPPPRINQPGGRGEPGNGRLAEINELRREQIAALQDAWNPAVYQRVEIEVDLSADGQILDVRVSFTSGRSALDRTALDAVRRALAERPLRDKHGAVTARYAVEASVHIDAPKLTPIMGDNTARIEGLMLPPLFSFSFDESRRKFEYDYPFKKRIKTRVFLLSVVESAARSPSQ